jgi:hypothetical protein
MNPLHAQEARRIVATGIPFGPRLHPCVCGEGRHAHSGKQGTGKCVGADCNCARYRADVAWELAYTAVDAGARSLGHALRDYDAQKRAAHAAANPRQAGEWSLGPSDAGTCRRAIWYKNLPPSDLVRDPVDMREARMGDIIHEEVVRRLAKLYPWREFEQKVTIPGLDREARFDWYDGIIARVTDLKTAGDWRWDQVDDFGPSEDVWKQGFLYALALHLQGKQVDTVEITYLKRCNGHDQTFVEDFDLELAQQYRQELIAIATALDIVHAEMERYEAEQARALAVDPTHTAPAYDPGDLLPRDRSGPSTDKLCQRCPFRSHCWNLEQAQQSGRSGESWTILGPSPEDTEIAWALEQNVAAKDLERDAGKAKDETKALFEGLTPGRYGDYKLDEQMYGGNPSYKQDSEQLRTMLAAGEIPDVETMPVPRPEKHPVLIARRVPKSELAKEARQKKKFLEAAAEAAADTQTTEVSA